MFNSCLIALFLTVCFPVTGNSPLEPDLSCFISAVFLVTVHHWDWNSNVGTNVTLQHVRVSVLGLPPTITCRIPPKLKKKKIYTCKLKNYHCQGLSRTFNLTQQTFLLKLARASGLSKIIRCFPRILASG
jgi:hypothetical protein